MNTETIKPEIEIDETHALISVEKINALEVFNGGMLPIIDEIHKKVAVLVPDITTAKGRKEIASMANKIARSKTLLDEVGKNLVADWKAKAKIVDDNRKLMRDKLDALKEATRRPLTEWEEAEAARVAKYETGLKDLLAFQTIPHGATVQHIADIIEDINRIEVGDDWGDLKDRAAAAKSYALQNANSRLTERKQYDEQQEEITRLRKAEAERQVKAAEEKRIAEAAERARQEAEAKVKAAQEAQKRAEERAAQAEANAKREAELAIKREEERKAAAEAEAKRRADAAAKQAELEKAKAEQERKQRERAAATRALRIQESTDALAEFIGKDIAPVAIDNIIHGNVPHISFTT